ncbi:lymphocyte antigen 6H-like [Dromiciops gliroides]|uniref:lymphocyte antigen 6H-like n=1 Tax=Dromiciops gliroides TaxID=33562 RepID=UPI001CC3C96F|nr:lymphocyte antigen 6H-like [Dromiciops gliroides]
MLSKSRVGSTGGLFLPIMMISFFPAAHGLQCYACNIVVGTQHIAPGCSKPEIVTCSESHQGFKHKFCIKTESVVLGILLTSGCATSRHCQQQELPGVHIRCCQADLCNGSLRAAQALGVFSGGTTLIPCLLMAFFLL